MIKKICTVILYGIIIFLIVFAILQTGGCRSDYSESYETPANFNYRLGDIVSFNRSPFGGCNTGSRGEPSLLQQCKLYRTHIPNSLAVKYIDAASTLSMYKRRNNIKILSQVINEHDGYNKFRNREDNIVIHIRIGDVIDNQPWTVDEFLQQERKWIKPGPSGFGIKGGRVMGLYVKTLSYYEGVIQRIMAKGLGLNLTIIAGFHKAADDHSKSLEYIEKVKRYFEDNGFKVTTRINSDPDEDFIYCSTSKYYIPSGGGFSNLMCKMVQYNSGTCLK